MFEHAGEGHYQEIELKIRELLRQWLSVTVCAADAAVFAKIGRE